MRNRLASRALLLCAALLCAACHNPSLTIGGPCTSDSDCGGGPKCIASAVTTDGGCVMQNQCWYVCQSDGDCAGTMFGSIATPRCYDNNGACAPSMRTCGPSLQ